MKYLKTTEEKIEDKDIVSCLTSINAKNDDFKSESFLIIGKYLNYYLTFQVLNKKTY